MDYRLAHQGMNPAIAPVCEDEVGFFIVNLSQTVNGLCGSRDQIIPPSEGFQTTLNITVLFKQFNRQPSGWKMLPYFGLLGTNGNELLKIGDLFLDCAAVVDREIHWMNRCCHLNVQNSFPRA